MSLLISVNEKRWTSSCGKCTKQYEGEGERLRKMATEIEISRRRDHDRLLGFILMNSSFCHSPATLAKAAFLTYSCVWPLVSSLASSSPCCWHSHLYSHMVNQSGELSNNNILAKLFLAHTNLQHGSLWGCRSAMAATGRQEKATKGGCSCFGQSHSQKSKTERRRYCTQPSGDQSFR